jgi:hypothetical protein
VARGINVSIRRELKRGQSVPKFELKPYQKIAIAFLRRCRVEYGFAILADEMGVGNVVYLKKNWLNYRPFRLSPFSTVLSKRPRRVKKVDRSINPSVRSAVFSCIFPLSLLNLIYRPPSLQLHWQEECYRFFDPDVLQAKLLTLEDFRINDSPDIIWLWPNSLMSNVPILELLLDSNVDIIALFADESHGYLRNKGSARCKAVLPIFDKAQMVVHISGTPFPLGPKTDAEDTMSMLGGEFRQKRGQYLRSKWVVKRLHKKLENLFKTTSAARSTGIFVISERLSHRSICVELFIVSSTTNPLPESRRG